jgi:soluble lytic murein transglycosylase-like protein
MNAQLTTQNKQLTEKLSVFTGKEIRLKNMRRSLNVAFGLSQYEARYYAYVFDDFSRQYHVNWEIYPAIIQVESRWRTNLTSNKKAMGLMQLIEDNARTQAKTLSVEYYRGIEFNAILNLVMGCTYVSEIIQKTSVANGVKSYIGGPAYEKNLKYEKVVKQLVDYENAVLREYQKLRLIHRGVSTASDSFFVSDSLSCKKTLFDSVASDSVSDSTKSSSVSQ